MIFTEWLSQEMEKRKWNASKLAKEAGVSKGALSHIFSNTRNPGIDMINGLARAFHLPTEEVMRKAGLLASDLEPDALPSLREWIQMFREADEETRQQMLDEARLLAKAGSQRKNA